MAQFFGTQAARWSPGLLMRDSAVWEPRGEVHFSDDETLAAAPVTGHQFVILGVPQPSVRIMMVSLSRDAWYQWLPGSSSLLLVNTRNRALATATVESIAEGQAAMQPQWVQDAAWAAQSYVTPRGAVGVLPSGLTVVVYAKRRAHHEDRAGFCFCVHGHDMRRCSMCGLSAALDISSAAHSTWDTGTKGPVHS